MYIEIILGVVMFTAVVLSLVAIILLARALASLPPRWRPDPDNPADPDKPRVLIRSDTARATHRFAQACRAAGVGISFGYPVERQH